MSPRGVPRIPSPAEWLRTRQCARCGRVLPYAKFSPRVYNPDGSVHAVYSRCQECDAETRRGSAARKAWDERNRERRRVYKREWERRNRRRDTGRSGMKLDVQPIQGVLRQAIVEHETVETVAQLCDCDSRALRRLLNGEHANVSLDLADRIAVGVGLHVTEIYPELAA